MVLGFALASAVAAAAPAPLTTLRAVAALTNAEASRHLPVSFEATVTYYFRPNSAMDVQDGDTAIYVRTTTAENLTPGDRVLVSGTTEPSFLPYVKGDSIRFLRHGKLPEAIAAGYDDLLGTKLNCRLVRVRGIIRALDTSPGRVAPAVRLQLLMDGGWVQMNVAKAAAGEINSLLDAEVEITGAAARLFDSKMQETGVKIKVSSLADIKVIQRAAMDPWKLPVTPLGDIITAYHVRDLSRRVRVEGTITYYEPGEAVVLQSGQRSLWVSTRTSAPLQIGDVGEATGFPDTRDDQLLLRHAEVRSMGQSAPVTPDRATWSQLAFWSTSAPGGYEYALVSINGQMLAEVREATQDEYVLTSGGRVFTALYRHPRNAVSLAPMSEAPVGSRVRVTGICVLTGAAPVNGEVPFDILMRSVDDIAVEARPPLWNVRDLTIAVVVLFGLVIVGVARSLLLERRVRRETAALAYLERRRSVILENINSGKPLAEILEQITEMVSFKLRGAPCWCEISDGARLGNRPPKMTSQRIVQREICGRSGTKHGTIFAALDGLTRPITEEHSALLLGVELATLAIETSQLYSDLVHRSEYDLLTDVHNRFSLERNLEVLIQTARQSARIFGLIYIDLNEFKLVNDNYGHQVGDLYLQEVTRRMQRQLRPGDTLARLGGDEFAVLVGGVHNRTEVEDIAVRLERCFDEPFAAGECTVNGSASLGIAIYPEDGTTRDALLTKADTAMYGSKNNDRGNGRTANGEAAQSGESKGV